MRFGVIFSVIMVVFTVECQEDTLYYLTGSAAKDFKHELEVDPISIWYNKDFSFGHRLKYTYLFDDKNRLSVETNGTLFNSLDAKAQGGLRNGVFPFLNRSQLVFENFRSFERRKPSTGKFMLSRIILRGGYHYFQHATGANHTDYWSIDSFEQSGLRTIAGFRSHSALVGLSYDLRIFQVGFGKLWMVNHRVSADYLFSPYFEVKLYDSDVASDLNVGTQKSPLPVNRSGTQLAYRFMCEYRNHFGLHADFEALWVPFMRDYQPNPNYFVPRGGERILPLFLNARIGIFWKF